MRQPVEGTQPTEATQFPEADFLAALLGFGEDFGGFLLLFLKGIDCGLQFGAGFGRGGDFSGEQAGDFAE